MQFWIEEKFPGSFDSSPVPPQHANTPRAGGPGVASSLGLAQEDRDKYFA